jgi:hypothetical protein
MQIQNLDKKVTVLRKIYAKLTTHAQRASILPLYTYNSAHVERRISDSGCMKEGMMYAGEGKEEGSVSHTTSTLRVRKSKSSRHMVEDDINIISLSSSWKSLIHDQRELKQALTKNMASTCEL